MPLVSLELARKHLRIDDPEDDDLLALYLAAAEQAGFDHMGRNAYVDDAALASAVNAGTAGDRPIVANAAIRAAVLLTLGDLWENREETVVGTIVASLPNGARSFLNSYRIGMGA